MDAKVKWLCLLLTALAGLSSSRCFRPISGIKLRYHHVMQTWAPAGIFAGEGKTRPVSRNVVWGSSAEGIFSFEMVHFDAFWSTF